MRRLLAMILGLCMLLVGCSPEEGGVESGMRLRDRMLACKSCEFTADLTVDFGENQYSFTLGCKAKNDGTVEFTVVSPETIAGISGRIDNRLGALSFDETVLAFPLIADGEIAPITAPWLFWKALLGGYIRAAGEDGQFMRLTIDDSFNGENVQVDIWLNENNDPVSAEIGLHGKVLLFLKISSFQIL